MLPVGGRFRALVVNKADGREEHADGDQHEAHGEQSGAGDAALIGMIVTAASTAAAVKD